MRRTIAAGRGPCDDWDWRRSSGSDWVWQVGVELVDVIKTPDLPLSKAPMSCTTGHDVICSYNTARLETPPTFYVPGAPPTYSPRPLPFRLSSGTPPPAVAPPDRHITAMFRALEMMNQKHRLDHINVLADHKIMKFLHRHAQCWWSEGARFLERRLNLRVMHNTAIISGLNDAPRGYIAATLL